MQTAGYGDFIIHLDMHLLPAQLPFKFRNWDGRGQSLQGAMAVSILHVLERGGKVC